MLGDHRPVAGRHARRLACPTARRPPTRRTGGACGTWRRGGPARSNSDGGVVRAAAGSPGRLGVACRRGPSTPCSRATAANGVGRRARDRSRRRRGSRRPCPGTGRTPGGSTRSLSTRPRRPARPRGRGCPPRRRAPRPGRGRPASCACPSTSDGVDGDGRWRSRGSGWRPRRGTRPWGAACVPGAARAHGRRGTGRSIGGPPALERTRRAGRGCWLQTAHTARPQRRPPMNRCVPGAGPGYELVDLAPPRATLRMSPPPSRAGVQCAARGSPPPWRPDLVPPASVAGTPRSSPPPDGPAGPPPARPPRADGPVQQGGHHALPEPLHRPAGARPVRRAPRHDRRPDRRHRRQVPARHRARRAHRPAPHLHPVADVATPSTSRAPASACARSTSASSASAQNEILLKANLLDKQIVDIEGRKVIRVNDVSLDNVEGRPAAGRGGRGRGRAAPPPGHRGPVPDDRPQPQASVPERYIDWEDVDPLDSTIASVRLRVPHAKLAELHPADLASIIEDLAPRDRVGVLASLDDEALADVVEEMEPETQVDVLEDLTPGAGGRHPRGDEPRRRGGPGRGPGPGDPRRDPRPHGEGRGRRGPGAAGLRRRTRRAAS